MAVPLIAYRIESNHQPLLDDVRRYLDDQGMNYEVLENQPYSWPDVLSQLVTVFITQPMVPDRYWQIAMIINNNHQGNHCLVIPLTETVA